MIILGLIDQYVSIVIVRLLHYPLPLCFPNTLASTSQILKSRGAMSPLFDKRGSISLPCSLFLDATVTVLMHDRHGLDGTQSSTFLGPGSSCE